MQIQTQLTERLESAFQPSLLEITNESHMHNVPENSETHFKAVVVSERFDGQRRVKRHQSVYALVSDLLEGELHALALHTYTPEEWHAQAGSAPASPACHGGEQQA